MQSRQSEQCDQGSQNRISHVLCGGQSTNASCSFHVYVSETGVNVHCRTPGRVKTEHAQVQKADAISDSRTPEVVEHARSMLAGVLAVQHHCGARPLPRANIIAA